MRRVIPGSKSEGERLRHRTSHQETVETLQAAGFRTGGFAGAGSSVRSQMSPDLLRRVEEAEALEDQKAAREQAVRAEAARSWQENQLQSAVTAALVAGEASNPRKLRGETLGHSPAEAVALASARQDHEDMLAEAAKREYLRRVEAQYDAGNQADNSPPTAEQLEAKQLMQQRAKRYREREQDREITARGIRAGVY